MRCISSFLSSASGAGSIAGGSGSTGGVTFATGIFGASTSLTISFSSSSTTGFDFVVFFEELQLLFS
jgi:hypothetical protein